MKIQPQPRTCCDNFAHHFYSGTTLPSPGMFVVSTVVAACRGGMVWHGFIAAHGFWQHFFRKMYINWLARLTSQRCVILIGDVLFCFRAFVCLQFLGFSGSLMRFWQGTCCLTGIKRTGSAKKKRTENPKPRVPFKGGGPFGHSERKFRKSKGNGSEKSKSNNFFLLGSKW